LLPFAEEFACLCVFCFAALCGGARLRRALCFAADVLCLRAEGDGVGVVVCVDVAEFGGMMGLVSQKIAIFDLF